MAENGDPQGPGGELQFDRAEMAGEPSAGVKCAACAMPLESSYFTANGKAVCPFCLEKLRAAMTGGSGAGRFTRATFFGLLAALVCAVLHYAIVAATDTQFALAAIVIGFAVGKAVNIGSRARGGWLYQTLAIFLTYFAIAASFLPLAIQGFAKAAEEHESKAGAPGGDEELEKFIAAAKDGGTTDTLRVFKLDDGKGTFTLGQPIVMRAGDEETSPSMGVLGKLAGEDSPFALRLVAFLVALLLLLGLALSVPLIAAFTSIMSFIILAVGLYEAWAMNKKAKLEIGGPFEVGAGPAHGAQA